MTHILKICASQYTFVFFALSLCELGMGVSRSNPQPPGQQLEVQWTARYRGLNQP